MRNEKGVVCSSRLSGPATWLGVFIFLVHFAYCLPLRAQVPNDDLDGRLPLTLGEPAESHTDGCTVQWACVDEKLTGKCIDYHNDQWFSFRPARAGRYYANIGSQNCRDVRGVQLVVLTGQPCQPSTYRIWSCTSLGTQDDVFIPIDAPQAGQEVLLNVDGYLHDFCRFRLTLDTVARGVPVVPPPSLPAATPVGSALVELSWSLPDTLNDATAFVVRRREASQPRAIEAGFVRAQRNAAGGLLRLYALTDTLPAPGRYVYQIVTEGTTEPVLVHQRAVSWSKRAQAPRLTLPLDRFRPGSALTVVVTDAFTGRVVRRTQFVRPKSGPTPPFFTADLVRQGLERVRILISEAGSSVVEEFETNL